MDNIDSLFIKACRDAALAFRLSGHDNAFYFYRTWFGSMAKKCPEANLKQWLQNKFPFKKKGEFSTELKKAVSRLEQGYARYEQVKEMNDVERLKVALDYFKECDAIVADVVGDNVNISKEEEQQVVEGRALVGTSLSLLDELSEKGGNFDKPVKVVTIAIDRRQFKVIVDQFNLYGFEVNCPKFTTAEFIDLELSSSVANEGFAIYQDAGNLSMSMGIGEAEKKA